MSAPKPLPSMQDFLNRLPPDTADNEVALATDFALALEAELGVAIDAFGPQYPFIGGVIRKEMKDVVNVTINNAVAALAAKLENKS